MGFVATHGIHLLPGILAVAALGWTAFDEVRTRRLRASSIGPGKIGSVQAANAGQPPIGAAGTGTVKVATLLVVAMASLSAGAGVIHLAVTGEHFAEFWLSGVFFLVVGAAQLIWVVAVLLRPMPATLTAGAIGNAAVVGVWVLSRTVGLPVGPDAGTPEVVRGLDGLATVFEILIAGTCVGLLSGWLDRRRGLPRAYELLGICGVLVVAVLTVTAIAGGTAGHAH
jgi:hypothetical protein